MKLKQSISTIKTDIPALSEDKEGKLLGGFAAFGVVGRSGSGNGTCPNNDDCDNNTTCSNNFSPRVCKNNGTCTNDCTRPVTTPSPTTTPEDTDTKPEGSGKNFFEFSMLF